MESVAENKRLEVAEAAVKFMVKELGAERALMVLPDHGRTKPLPTTQYGFKSTQMWGDTSVNHAVLKGLLEGKSSILVGDSRTHPQYISRESNRCSLGASLPQGGILYCDHSEAGKLEDEQRRKLLRYAGSVDKKLQASLKAADHQPSETIQQIKSSKPVLAAIALIVGVLMFLGFQAIGWESTPVKPSQVAKTEYEVKLQGRFKNFRGNRRPSPKSKFVVTIVGGDRVVLSTEDLNFDNKGNYSANLKTKMAQVPSRLSMKVDIPRHKSETIMAGITDQVANLPEVTLVRFRRKGRNATQARQGDASSTEREALNKLSRNLSSKRKRKPRSTKKP